ncbi:MAG: UvrD-helicase domain-containing protein [Fibromonadaceae bacterium]|nr:UvrD-helicase domain-containing protein [Fibromonadaceae bacterium]
MLSITPSVLQQELNPVQCEAAAAIDGPMLILAGAGSGKTRTIAYKIAHLISCHNIEARRIAAVTFTNKAAKEMKERIASILEYPHIRLDWMGTFHSLSVKILRTCLENPAVINALKWEYTKHFSIYDDDDQKKLLKLIVVPIEGDLANAARMKKIGGMISFWKNGGTTPEEASKESFYDDQKVLANYYAEYQKQLMKANAMDFDDLLLRAADILREIPKIAAQFTEHFQYIFVDEYQDTNDAQYALLKLLLSNTNRNITVVGDDDQSIYGWRGANLSIIRSFHRDFAPVKIVKLEENYRSSANIVRAAGSVIANNKRPKEMEKNVFSNQEKGSLILIKQMQDDELEAMDIAYKILSLGMHNYSKTAIFYRMNAQSRLIESALNKMRIPNIIIGGTRFWDRMEVKDILAYMRLLVNPRDNAALLRVVNVPPRGLGKKTIETLRLNAESNGTSLWDALSTVPKLESFSKLVNGFLQEPHESIVLLTKKIIEDIKYAEYLEKDDPEKFTDRKANLDEMLRGVADFCEENPDATLESFLQDISLLTSADRKNENSTDFVTLMTLHSAKGLEFDSVHIAGCDEGILPSKAFSMDMTPEERNEKLEEERRLFYVGLTRARKHLYLYTTQSRFWHGERKNASPSSFIEEMDASTVYFERLSPTKSKPLNKYATPYSPLPTPRKHEYGAPRKYEYDEYSQVEPKLVGRFVSHNKYGRGKVVGKSGMDENTQLEILFADGIKRKFVLKFANLRFD